MKAQANCSGRRPSLNSGPSMDFNVSRVENVSYARRQIGIGERLGNQLNAWIEAAMMNNGITSISGRVEDFELRTPPAGLFNKLASIHAWKPDIGEQQID